jgi:hypothetical protein
MTFKLKTLWIAALPTLTLVFLAVVAGAGSVSVPNDFTAGQVAVAADVNANFAAVETAINDNDARITALQNLANIGGIARAAVCVQGGPSPSVVRQYSNLPGTPTITVTRPVLGQYLVDFGADVSNRFYVAVVGRPNSVNPLFGGEVVVQPDTNNQRLRVWTTDSAGFFDDRDFYVIVH